MKRKCADYIARVVLFVVYASFFVVQSFFIANNNYQSSIPVGSGGHVTVQVKSPLKSSTVTVSAKKQSDRPSGSRLNRRFQPQDMLFYAVPDIQPPASLFTPEFTCSKPTGHLLISSILVDSLRGPPAIG